MSQFLRVAYGRRCAAPILAVIDGQQNIRVSGQKVIALQQTIFLEDPADINNGIRLRQNGVIPGLVRSGPLRFLSLIGKDAVQFDTGIFKTVSAASKSTPSAMPERKSITPS